jgi:cobyric acid synthase
VRREIIMINRFEGKIKDIELPGIKRIKNVEGIHITGVDKFVENKRQTGFEKSIVFAGPIAVQRMGYDITVVHFIKNKTGDKDAFVFS